MPSVGAVRRREPSAPKEKSLAIVRQRARPHTGGPQEITTRAGHRLELALFRTVNHLQGCQNRSRPTKVAGGPQEKEIVAGLEPSLASPSGARAYSAKVCQSPHPRDHLKKAAFADL